MQPGPRDSSKPHTPEVRASSSLFEAGANGVWQGHMVRGSLRVLFPIIHSNEKAAGGW